MADVVSNLKEIRRRKRTPVDTLAERARVSRSMIYDIEAGNHLPGLEVAYKLAHALGSHIEEVFPFQNAG